MKNPEIAKRITFILNLRGMKAQDLSYKTGINKASISQYVNGNHCPSNDKAQLMADVLKVNPLWLMGFDVPMVESDNSSGERTKLYNDLICRYSKLDDNAKNLVDNLIETLLNK